MFVIFCPDKFCLQISFQHELKSDTSRAIYFANRKLEANQNNTHFTIFTLPILTNSTLVTQFPDFRIELNPFLFRLSLSFFTKSQKIFFFLKNLFHSINSNSKKKKIVLGVFISFVFLSVSSLLSGTMDEEKYTLAKPSEEYLLNKESIVLDKVLRVEFARRIYEDKLNYSVGIIPNISGIKDFIIMPLTYADGKNNEEILPVSILLALPFNKATVLHENNAVNEKFPIVECLQHGDRPFAVFQFAFTDKLILLTKKHQLFDKKNGNIPFYKMIPKDKATADSSQYCEFFAENGNVDGGEE